MNVAFIGCGFVADFFIETIKSYNQINLKKVYDKDKNRLKQFADYYGLKIAKSFEEILLDDDINLVINLTNPREHFKVIKTCLSHNKHVYTEKPLSMNFKEAKQLLKIAKKNQLRIASAPSSVLSVTAKTIKFALNKKLIGNPKLVYANFDAGMMTHKMDLHKWRSQSGALWPALDEFEVGCTYQHAGYFFNLAL